MSASVKLIKIPRALSGIFAALILAPQFTSAQDFAPAALATGSTVTSETAVVDNPDGNYDQTTDIRFTSATTFQATVNGFVSTGTYSYTKTGLTTGTLTYTSNYSEPSFSETETATVLLTFTNYGVGTLTSSGTYSGNNDGDPFNGSFTSTGTFTFNGPAISNVTDKSVAEDTSTGAIPFTVGDGQTAGGSLTVTRSSSNTSLVPLANVVLGGSGNNRTVTITPAANLSGMSTITLTVSDGTYTTSDTFLLTVEAVNDAPTISDVTDKQTNHATSTGAIPFTVGDVETAAGSLTVTRASSNTTLVPLANVVLGGSGENRTVTITPAANQAGTATITLTVSDGSLNASDTFVLTVVDGQSLVGWRQTYFQSTANSGDGADLNDFDKDSIVNLLEYALGTIPNDSASANHLVSQMEMIGGQPYITLTVPKPPGITGITYVVEVSGSLDGWSSGAANTTIITDNSTTLKVRDNTPAIGGSRFIRLKVTNP
jgi:hypothetical protein